MWAKRRGPSRHLDHSLVSYVCNHIHWHNCHLSRVVSEAIKKMDGKYLDIATSHITARVLQVSWAHTVFVNLLRFLLCCLCPAFWWSVDYRLLADMCKVVLTVREGCYFWCSTSTFARSFSQEICGFPCKEACRTRYISYNFIYGSDHAWACGYVRMLHDSLIWPLASLTCLLFAVAASKKQFASFISSLHGRVAKLLHHTIGAAGVCSIMLLQWMASDSPFSLLMCSYKKQLK